MKIISTVEDFFASFHEGDNFWYMLKWAGKPPARAAGPCRIISLSVGTGSQSPLVTFGIRRLRNYVEEVETWHVANIVNAHDVFANKAEADMNFERQRKIWRTHGELRKYVEFEMERLRIITEQDS